MIDILIQFIHNSFIDLCKSTDDGKKILVKEDVDQARTLSDFFSSLFTREATTEIPELEDKIIRKPTTY